MTSTSTVTILFTDVVGSTALRTSRGDLDAHEVLEEHNALVRQEIEAYAGQEVKTIGDAFMVAFASSRQAVQCAIAVQRALEGHNKKAPDRQVHVRIGLHVGEVIEQQGDFFGSSVDAAARILAQAKGDQILVSEAVRMVVASAKEIEFVDKGRFNLKGFVEHWRLYEVNWHEAGTVHSQRGRPGVRSLKRRLASKPVAILALIAIAVTGVPAALLLRDSSNSPSAEASAHVWRLVAADDFRDSDTGLFHGGQTQERISGDGTKSYTIAYTYTNGALVCTTTTGGSAVPNEHLQGSGAPADVTVSGNFAVEVSVGLLKSTVASYEVGLIYATSDGSFTVAVTPYDGQYHINLPASNLGAAALSAGRLYAWRPSPAVKTGLQNNRIRLDVARDTLTLHVNGQLVDALEWSGLSLKSGKVVLEWTPLGPYAQAALEVQFTDFKLYALDE